jgi:hypothetical protein
VEAAFGARLFDAGHTEGVPPWVFETHWFLRRPLEATVEQPPFLMAPAQ